MRKSKRTILLSVAVLGVSAAALLVTTNSGTAHPGQHVATPAGPVELADELRTRPDLPIGSIPLVSPTPGHAPAGLPKGGKGCDKDVDLTTTTSGVVPIAAQDNIICTNADIDTYLTASSTYVVQAGGQEAAWTHTDVSDPANPVIVGQFKWKGSGTYTPDIKTFRQGSRDYIVMGLERITLGGGCGVIIYDVTNPGSPVKQSQYIGSTSNQSLGPFWCDTHNVFVVDDTNNDGAFIFATADNSADLRVLDISVAPGGGSVTDPVEIGRYFRQTRGFFDRGLYDDIYVHDVTVRDGTVYASYWEAGLDFFPMSLITPGIVNETNGNVANIDPPDFASGNPFLVHHAFPSNTTESLVAFQDEIEINSGAKVVQLWTTATSSLSFVDGLAQGSDIPVIPSHNLEIRDDLVPNRLYAGWYKAGLEAWDIGSGGFSREPVSQGRTSVQYHQVQTEANDGAYSGAWGVRLENITVDGVENLYLFQSDRNFGLIIDCVGCSVSPPPPPPPPPPPSGAGTIKGTVTDDNTGARLRDVTVTTDTDQSATTNKRGMYKIKNVPEGERTVTASSTGYITQSKPATVVAEQTTTVDFALVPQ